MKDVTTIFCIVGMVLLLTACNTVSVPGGSAATNDTSATEAQSVSENGADSSVMEDEYSEHKAIRVDSLGSVEWVPSTRYTGDGWRVYVPDTWIPVEAEDYCWQSDEDSRVTVQVVMLDGISDYSVVEEYLMESFSAYDLHLTGNDAYIGTADGTNLIVQMEGVIGESYCYILGRWPDDASEGLSSTLGSISDTFSFISAS